MFFVCASCFKNNRDKKKKKNIFTFKHSNWNLNYMPGRAW